MKTVWIVVKKDWIYGRFNTKEKATNYLIDLWFDGIEGVKVKEVPIDEYNKMCYNLIKKER